MQVFEDIFPICCCSIILYLSDTLYITSIKSFSVICSCPSFSNSKYLLTFHRWCRYFDWFINFLFHQHEFCSFYYDQPYLGPHISSHDLTYVFKSQVFQVCGINHDGDFHYRLAFSCSQKEIHNLIFSSLCCLSAF